MRARLFWIALIAFVAGCGGGGASIGPTSDVRTSPSATAGSPTATPSSPSPGASQTPMAGSPATPSPSASPTASSGSTLSCTTAPTSGWVGIWGTSPVTYYMYGADAAGGPMTNDPFGGTNAISNQTLRMIAHPSMGASTVRIRLSNTYGDRPLVIDSVRIARAVSSTSPKIVASTNAPVTFGCATGVTIAPGMESVSDPVTIAFAHGDDLAVTYFIKSTTGHVTFHVNASQTNYATAANGGDTTSDVDGTSFTTTTTNSFLLTGIDAYAPTVPGTVVAFGDSITDGYTLVAGANTRWPDDLANALDRSGKPTAIIQRGNFR